MLKNILPATLLLPASLGVTAAQNHHDNPKDNVPNIIFILADDLGIGDLGCYGQKDIKTPAIDSMAKQGMIFNRHYSGSTVSAPSRCVLMTGKHTGHSYIRGNKGVKASDGRSYDYPLADNEITVAEILKSHGYATACIGKWGLGGPESEGHPNNQGVDYFFGYLGQGNAHRYYPEFLFENGEKIFLNRKVYSHDLIMSKALDFVNKSADKPFFLYLTPTIPHADLDVPELGEYDGKFKETPYINKSKNGGGYKTQMKPRATYAAMVSRLDSDIARLIKVLKEKNIYDNTLIIFTSDNGVHAEGGHDPEFFNSNSIYRGIKRDLYEGGIHTPFIALWSSRIKAGSSTDHIATFWDFLPTVCDIIGINPPENTDGISYLPTLSGTGSQPKHDMLYYEFHEKGGKRAIVKDGWKLVELNSKNPKKAYYELYNLDNDIKEKHNLISENMRLARKLKRIMDNERTTNEKWDFHGFGELKRQY